MKHKQYDNEILINAFLTCKTHKEITEKTGVALSTIGRYKKDKEFQAILNERKLEYISAAVSNMQSNLSGAVNELMKIINDKSTQPQIKVNAIQVLFSQCRTWTETIDNVSRIENLENELKELDKERSKGVLNGI